MPSNFISGAGAGDILEVLDHEVTGVLYGAGLLTIGLDDGHAVQLTLQGAYRQSDFSVSGNTVAVACYATGTRIATPGGEVAIETLRIGDWVITGSGEAGPVKWIGHRSYDGRFIAGNHLMLPITFRAGALADGVPHTDLVVSPGHAMWVNGQWVPAWRLVNGVTITQAEVVAEISYHHVELHQHGVLFANGAPAESFLDDTGFRRQFHNAAEFDALYPDTTPVLPQQQRLEDGFALQAIQDRLAARAGMQLCVEPVGPLQGYVDETGPDRICGWAQDGDSPGEPVALEISIDGVPVLCVLANAYRADLRQAGIGSGCHAFDVEWPGERVGAVTVRRVTDGAVLRHSGAADEARRAA